MTVRSFTRPLIVAITSLLIVTTSAYADKPDKGNGNGNSGKNKGEQYEKGNKSDKGNKQEKGSKSSGKSDRDDGLNSGVNFSFRSDDSRLVRDFYGKQVSQGKCPPGLAKKGNGCQPPGQAKNWQRGQPLGSDVRYYDIPNELRLRLPTPPRDHRYVQSGTDLLLIQAGTAIVVDAIVDIL